MEEIKIYTIEEIKNILKITKRSIYRFIKSGQLKAVKIGREYRITQEELERFINAEMEKGYTKKL